jgi:hypothetical protein
LLAVALIDVAETNLQQGRPLPQPKPNPGASNAEMDVEEPVDLQSTRGLQLLRSRMRHFVAYHRADRMGYDAEACDSFSHYTNKRIKNLIGDTVWVITGEPGYPKQYYLVSCFIVEAITPADHGDFGLILRGQGRKLEPMAHLNDLDWFPQFRRRMGNFALGLQRVKDPEIIAAFHQLAMCRGVRENPPTTEGSSSQDP